MKTKLKSFTKTVAASGTPEAIAAQSIQSSFIKIKALSTNGGLVFIGDSAGQEYSLAANQELSLDMLTRSGGAESMNLQDIFCRVATNGNGVCVIYSKEE